MKIFLFLFVPAEEMTVLDGTTYSISFQVDSESRRSVALSIFWQLLLTLKHPCVCDVLL